MQKTGEKDIKQMLLKQKWFYFLIILNFGTIKLVVLIVFLSKALGI